MWLHKVSDITSDSEIQHSYPLWRHGKGGVHPTETKYVGWSSDGTAGAMSGLMPLDGRKMEARGLEIGGRLGRRDMEEDENKRERHGNVRV